MENSEKGAGNGAFKVTEIWTNVRCIIALLKISATEINHKNKYQLIIIKPIPLVPIAQVFFIEKGIKYLF